MRDSHELAGLAAYSGIGGLEETANRLHRAAKAGEAGEAKALVERLLTDWPEIRAQVSRRFGLDG